MSYNEIGALMLLFFLCVGFVIFIIGTLKKESKQYQELKEYRSKRLELLEKLVNKKEIEKNGRIKKSNCSEKNTFS